MTKQEFWKQIANCIESCDYCPVSGAKIINEGCYDNCAKSLEILYEQLTVKEQENLKELVRQQFMDLVYSELSDDADNYRANRIIDAADEYVEEVMRLERESQGGSK